MSLPPNLQPGSKARAAILSELAEAVHTWQKQKKQAGCTQSRNASQTDSDSADDERRFTGNQCR